MRVLIAFDKFKGALAAPEACARVAEVRRRERPSWELDEAPLADGGDGFGRILTDAAGGTWRAELARQLVGTVTVPGERPDELASQFADARADAVLAIGPLTNVAALCVWGHLVHDIEQHRDTRRERKDRVRRMLEAAL